MNKKIVVLYICIAVLLAVMSSCENEMSFRGSHFEPKLVMNGFIHSDSLTNSVMLCLTGEKQVAPVGDVTVKVQVNGELRETIRPPKVEESPYRYAKITTPFQPGEVIRIEAITDDGDYYAWMEETVPYPVQINQIDTTTATYTSAYGQRKSMRIKVNFNDRPNEKNYYRIVVEVCFRLQGKTISGVDSLVTASSHYFWPWEDIALTDGSPATTEELNNDLFERVTNIYGVFTDSWFTDSEYTLTVSTSAYDEHFAPSVSDFIPEIADVDIIIKLLSITEIEFHYLSALNLIDSDILDDYISDPVKIPSNVHGGTGFVGINSGDSKVIEVLRDQKLIFGDYYR